MRKMCKPCDLSEFCFSLPNTQISAKPRRTAEASPVLASVDLAWTIPAILAFYRHVITTTERGRSIDLTFYLRINEGSHSTDRSTIYTQYLPYNSQIELSSL